jgi:antitoxin (DNA-binding transcriptional repressor) of toxin-antitoxin stability system
MKVSAQYAQVHFADLIDAASNGEEVEIAVPDNTANRNRTPLADGDLTLPPRRSL